MVIKTLDKNYTVIRELWGQYSIDRYVCREDGSEVLATLVCIRDRDIIRANLDFLMQQQKNHKFSDFKDCFMSEGALYAAFSFQDSRAVSDFLTDSECSLEQRLAMMRAILEKLILLSMPDYFMWDALDRTHIFLSDDLEVFFQFGFWKLSNHEKCSFSAVLRQYVKIFELLFSEELIRKSVPQFLDFLDDVEAGKYTNLLELFMAYDLLEKEILAVSAKEWKTPKTWPFRLWDRLRTWFPAIRRMAMLLLFAAACSFLVWSFQKSMSSGDEMTQFDEIGTLKIKDNSTE
ncbi:MAG: hypothetical protein IJ679_05610 [Lachnospiraceae bacterium]|nr:hypothetical protein [Lachnospiraceae bacterium]